MNFSEIMDEIHKEKMEVDIYNALHDWILNDRKSWIDKARENYATIKAIEKIGTKVNHSKKALEGIVNLCQSDNKV